jgi:hypothetical protein
VPRRHASTAPAEPRSPLAFILPRSAQSLLSLGSGSVYFGTALRPGHGSASRRGTLASRQRHSGAPSKLVILRQTPRGGGSPVSAREVVPRRRTSLGRRGKARQQSRHAVASRTEAGLSVRSRAAARASWLAWPARTGTSERATTAARLGVPRSGEAGASVRGKKRPSAPEGSTPRSGLLRLSPQESWSPNQPRGY